MNTYKTGQPLTGICCLQILKHEFSDSSSHQSLLVIPLWDYKVSNEKLTSLKLKFKSILEAKESNIINNISILFDIIRDEYFVTLFCQRYSFRVILIGENETHIRQYLINLTEAYNYSHHNKSPYKLVKYSPKFPKILQQNSLAKLTEIILNHLISLTDKNNFNTENNPVLKLGVKQSKLKKYLQFILGDVITKLMGVMHKKVLSIVEKQLVKFTRFA